MTTKTPPTEVGSAAPRTTSEDPESVGGRSGLGQARQIHLVVGPVGAGKSTYATALASRERALRLTLDDWMARLFRPDRPATEVIPWYVERARRCVDQIWVVARASLAVGVDVVLEIGLLRRDEREAFRARAESDEPEASVVMHVLDADRDVRRARVAQRNAEEGATFSMEVPPAIFEMASDMWEPLSDEEGEGLDVRRVRTDGDRHLGRTAPEPRSSPEASFSRR